MLPLDLHVLGLPLAFILSQDQTLHCILYFMSFRVDPTFYYFTAPHEAALKGICYVTSYLNGKKSAAFFHSVCTCQ